MSETTLTIKEAREVVKRALGEVSLWQQLTPNLQKVGAAMDAFEEKEAAAAKLEATHRDLEQRIASAATCCQYDEQQATEAKKRKEAATSECKTEERKLADLRALRGKTESVVDLDAEIKELTGKRDTLKAEIAAILSRHSL